jgi:hypothetical protein
MVSAIEDARPAGVHVALLGEVPPRKVDVELRLVTLGTLLEQDLRAAHDAVRAKIADYFARLPVRADGSVNKLIGLALAVPGVEDVRILNAKLDDGTDVLDRDAGTLAIADLPTVLGALRIADPNLATTLNAAVTYPDGDAPPDASQIRGALEEVIAYLNNANASEPAGAVDQAKRVVAYGKLLLVTPLPDHAPGDLEDHDALVADGGAPPLPDASAILPYRVSFVLTQSTGLTSRLSQAAHTYTLTPFERITLGGVEVAVE